MIHRYAALGGLCLLLAAPLANATPARAAATGVGTLYPCPSFCGGPGGRFDFDIDGGVGPKDSYSSLSNIDGSGQALASLDGPTALPILKAEAYSQAFSRVSAEAVGMQGFFYDGSGNGDYELEVSLSGLASGRLEADVFVFIDHDPESDPDFSTDDGTMRFEIIDLSDDLELLDVLNLQIPGDEIERSVTGSLFVSGLNYGDLIYVWAGLLADGIRGGYADGFNTLNLAFTDPTGLSQEPPPAIVPLPGTMALLGPALLLGLRRRRLERAA